MIEPDMQPETLDVLQAEPEPAMSVIPVHICGSEGAIRIQSLPRKDASTSTKPISTTPLQVLFADHRRASAFLVSFGQDMLVAFNSGSTQSPDTSSRWPMGVPLSVTATTDVWVSAFTGTGSVSITSEKWATGE